MNITARQAGKKWKPTNHFFYGWITATVFNFAMYMNWWSALSQICIALIVLLVEYKMWAKRESGTHVNADDLNIAHKIIEYSETHDTMKINEVMEFVGLNVNKQEDMVRILGIVRAINKDAKLIAEEENEDSE